MTLLTPEQAAESLHVSRRYLYGELRAGRLRASRYGARWHISREALDEYVKAHENVAPKAQRRLRRSA